MTERLPGPATRLKLVALAVMAIGGLAGVEAAAKSLTGLAAMMSPAAWQGAYRQDLALDTSREAAELHLATFGWSSNTDLLHQAICAPEDAAARMTAPGVVAPQVNRPRSLDQPL